MLQFDAFVARHGEIVAQAIIENLERFEGIRARCGQSLEQRWTCLMQTHDQPALAA